MGAQDISLDPRTLIPGRLIMCSQSQNSEEAIILCNTLGFTKVKKVTVQRQVFLGSVLWYIGKCGKCSAHYVTICQKIHLVFLMQKLVLCTQWTHRAIYIHL